MLLFKTNGNVDTLHLLEDDQIITLMGLAGVTYSAGGRCG